MGTQHGYIEKECKVCGVTKAREQFPAYGGLTCRDCMRDKEREARPDRYERDKKNPKYVEENRRRAREYKRKKKAERDQRMSIEESASELRETGAKVVQDIGGMVQQINTDLDAIAAKLQQSQTFAEDSTNTAATVLGEGHPGTGEIVGAAANVVEQVVSMQGLVSQFSLEATTLTERAGALSQKFEEIANRLMG